MSPCSFSTITDHVAPWRSVYKIQALTSTENTFVLSNGGHNVGIVNPPGTPNRHYQLATQDETTPYVDPARWQETAQQHQGSWWPAWMDWLAVRSGTPRHVPEMGAPSAGYSVLGDAPGTYVCQT